MIVPIVRPKVKSRVDAFALIYNACEVQTKSYHPLRAPSSEFVEIRAHNYHLNVWGEPAEETIYLLHGWGDCGGSFQFLIDAFSADRHVIAPDWRGFGKTDCEADSYFFPDYLADLDALLQQRSPDAPVTLVGHSMGGNIASLYSGIFPDRVARLINIEGFGLGDCAPELAPERYAKWLEELRAPPAFSEYGGFEALAERIRQRSPGLSRQRALYVARLWAREQHGSVCLRASAAHKTTNPVLYRRAEARACWSRITARTLLLVGAAAAERAGAGPLQDLSAALVAAPVQISVVPDSGHMVHFEQPARLAGEIEAFLDT